jgi:uncharacterized protein (TIGR03083 family)
MSDASTFIATTRAVQDRFARLVAGIDPETARQPSYDDEWSIAQVASHLGSQAEIYELFLDAGLAGQEAPGSEVFGPIWARWDAAEPEQQLRDSVAANERFVARLEGLSGEEAEAFALSMFGSDVDLAGFVALRLSEHAVHSWDIEVARDPAAVMAADAVEILVDRLGAVIGFTGRPVEEPSSWVVATTGTERQLVLTTAPQVSLTPYAGSQPASADLTLPAEALVRLVYGRLDPAHTPDQITDEQELLPVLRTVFPGV